MLCFSFSLNSVFSLPVKHQMAPTTTSNKLQLTAFSLRGEMQGKS